MQQPTLQLLIPKHCRANFQLRRVRDFPSADANILVNALCHLYIIEEFSPVHSTIYTRFVQAKNFQTHNMAIDEDMEALRKISTTSSCPTESSLARNVIFTVEFTDHIDFNQLFLTLFCSVTQTPCQIMAKLSPKPRINVFGRHIHLLSNAPQPEFCSGVYGT